MWCRQMAGLAIDGIGLLPKRIDLALFLRWSRDGGGLLSVEQPPVLSLCESSVRGKTNCSETLLAASNVR